MFACPPMIACGEMHRKEILPLLPGPILVHRGLLVWTLMQSLIAMSRCRGVRPIQTWYCVAAHLLCRARYGKTYSLCLLLLFAVLLLVLFSETPGLGGCQVRVKKIFLFSFVWQVIGDKINYVLSERGAASALGGWGGVLRVGCLSGVLLVPIFSFLCAFGYACPWGTFGRT